MKKIIRANPNATVYYWSLLSGVESHAGQTTFPPASAYPYDLLYQIVTNPTEYGGAGGQFAENINGFPNNYQCWTYTTPVDIPCALYNNNENSIAFPDPDSPYGFIFYNYIHPSATGHAIVAANIRACSRLANNISQPDSEDCTVKVAD